MRRRLERVGPRPWIGATWQAGTPTDMVAYALQIQGGVVKAGDFSSVPVRNIPIEKGEPLARELADFVKSVAETKEPKVGAALGKSPLEDAITITEQIRAASKPA